MDPLVAAHVVKNVVDAMERTPEGSEARANLTRSYKYHMNIAPYMDPARDDVWWRSLHHDGDVDKLPVDQ